MNILIYKYTPEKGFVEAQQETKATEPPYVEKSSAGSHWDECQ